MGGKKKLCIAELYMCSHWIILSIWIVFWHLSCKIFEHLADTTRYVVNVHLCSYVAQLKCVSCTNYEERGGSEP